MPAILINGIDSVLGAKVAQVLSVDEELHLIGLGKRMPVALTGRAEVLTASLDGHQIADLLRAEGVETVIHLDIAGEEEPVHSREIAVQHNVLGTMELLGACAAAGVERVVVRSSTLIYGSGPNLPLLLDEHTPITQSAHTGLLKDLIEIETFVADFRRRQPDLEVTVLRCAGIVGGGVWSPLARYLVQAAPRVLIGFNPRIQVLHADDAAGAFAHAAVAPATGVFNLAADGILTLSQAIRRTGHQPVPVLEPLVSMYMLFGRVRDLLGAWPYDPEFLRYGCVADTRRAHCTLGWTAQFSAEEAIGELRAGRSAYRERAQAEVALQAFLSRRSHV